MSGTRRQWIAPAYLALCLIFGGSAQGVWGNLLLQLLGIAIIGWALIAPSEQPLDRAERQLVLIIAAGLAIIALQWVPLPPAIWSKLGGRAAITQGFRMLGLPMPALPISLAPYETLATALALIPPLAMIAAMLRLKAYRASYLAAALIAGAVVSVVLGALQVSTARSGDSVSAYYPYAETNYGAAVGFFANANHLATLMVITLPFLAASVAAAKGAKVQRYWAFVGLASTGSLVLAVGIALNRSLAGLGLTLPVLAASTLLLVPGAIRFRGPIAIGAGLLAAAVVAGLFTSAIGVNRIGQDISGSTQSRQEILGPTIAATRDFMPFGSGVGTFRDVYHLYEPVESVTSVYVIHAHNDFAELALETGLAGIVLILVFLAWWGAAAARAWRSPATGTFARAATIASAVILLHSLVDFPLRTGAISACFAMCLALIIARRVPPPSERPDLRPSRHLVYR